MRYQKLRDDIDTIEYETKPYGALRFVAGAINIIGLAMIIMHSILTVVVIYPFIHARLIDQMVSVAIAVLAWGIGVIMGTFIIAQGQMLELFLDIRNDMRITRRYVRRFGLFMARDTHEEPTQKPE